MKALTVTVALALVASFAVALAETQDYPDACDGYPVVEVGEPVTGTLAPPDDAEDHVGLNVTERHVGQRINVSFVGNTHHLDIQVFTPECRQDVAPQHAACEHAKCPPGHENELGKGHTLCKGQGHPECGDGESGEDYVSFVPSEAGVYVVLLSVDTTSYHCNGNDCHFRSPPGKDDPGYCVDLCYDGGPSANGGSGGDYSTESCHLNCAGETLDYTITSTDSTTIE